MYSLTGIQPRTLIIGTPTLIGKQLGATTRSQWDLEVTELPAAMVARRECRLEGPSWRPLAAVVRAETVTAIRVQQLESMENQGQTVPAVAAVALALVTGLPVRVQWVAHMEGGTVDPANPGAPWGTGWTTQTTISITEISTHTFH